MSRGKKDHFTSVSREELLRDLDWNRSSFENRFERFMKLYDYESSYNVFKKDPQELTSEYSFSWEWYPLLRTLLRSMLHHPYYREKTQTKNITTESITEYYEAILNEIEQLPDYLKYEIKTHAVYQNILKENHSVKELTNKIAEFIVAIQLITNQESSEIMGEIINKLDDWIYQAYRNNYALNLALQSNQKENSKLINQMINRDNKKKRSGSEDEHLRGYLHKEEALKLNYSSQSQIDALLILIMNKYISNEKLLKEELQMPRAQKKLRQQQVNQWHQEKQELFAKLNKSIKEDSSNKVDEFRYKYEEVLLNSLNITEDHIEHIDAIIENIERKVKSRPSIESRIKETSNEFNQMSSEQKEKKKTEYINYRRAQLEATIKRSQKELLMLEKGEIDDNYKEMSRYQKDIDLDYLKFCNEIRTISSKYVPATQSFIGQLLAPSFQFPTNK